MTLFKSFNRILIATLFVAAFTSCDIVDKFDSFPLNVPVTAEIHTSGSAANLVDSDSFCLGDSKSFKDYADQIEEVSFLEASYRTTDDPTPLDLSGDIQVTVMDGNNNILFSVTIQNVKPADYINTPVKLTLTGDQVAAINSYVSVFANQCFTATVSITNLPGGNKEVNGAVDLLFSTKVKI